MAEIPNKPENIRNDYLKDRERRKGIFEGLLYNEIRQKYKQNLNDIQLRDRTQPLLDNSTYLAALMGLNALDSSLQKPRTSVYQPEPIVPAFPRVKRPNPRDLVKPLSPEEKEAKLNRRRQLTPEQKIAQSAARRRAAKLREPHVQALLRFVRNTPHLFEQLQNFLKRKNLLLAGTSEEDETHRSFTPLLAGLAVNAETRAYLEILLDEAATAESEALKEAAESDEGYYTPVLVIGAGTHGSIFNNQFLADRPDIWALTVDQDTNLGGNFRRPKGPAYETNSRNRAYKRSVPGLPGTSGSINSMGDKAPLQVSDVSGKIYAGNDDFGIVTALNEYLSGNTMLGVRVTKVEKNREEEMGKYVATIEDVQSGRKFIVKTDVVVTATGVGVQKFGLDTSDIETAKLLEKLQRGELPQVLPYQTFLQDVGDRSNHFPLEKFAGKKIAVIGDRDASNTVIQELTRLGIEYRGSVAQMGNPFQIIWYGPKFNTQKEFRKCTRLRYSQIGLFLPEKEGDQALVMPVNERANTLKEENGRITIGSRDKDSTNITDDFDYVILATGFEDRTSEIFKGLLKGQDLEESLEIVESKGKKGRKTTIAKQISGESIYFVGPVANIPVTKAERRKLAGLKVPENSQAIWRYADKTTQTAQKIAPTIPAESNRQGSISIMKPTRLTNASDLKFILPAEHANRMFPPEVNYSSLLRMQISAALSPDTVTGFNNSTLAFTINRNGLVENDTQNSYSATIVEGLSLVAVRWVQRFINEELNQRLVGKLIGKSGSVTVRVPSSGGRLSIDEIEITTKTKTEKK